ncbi:MULTISPECIES: DUF2075 domain-containing protein [Methylotenera]|uniref:DUF2075 domain-containing protein n=1 Tax=Methylotenera TaxID=359407 RepID=UPI0003680070|nr:MULTISPECIES: DUF2075 domain-containing protein [Methylotenera]
MIVYSGTKHTFSEHVKNNEIAEKIHESFISTMGQKSSPGEIRSWENSMMYMCNVLNDDEIPHNAGVAIEYKIPTSSKRIDFILTGANHLEEEIAVIIELKQWDKIQTTDEDGIVETFVGGGIRRVTHPSYQAWSYARLIKDFSEIVQQDKIEIIPCAYLHNYHQDDVIRAPFYEDYINKAPLFLRKESGELTNFIKKFIKSGDQKNTLFKIDNGKIKPSKSLADSLDSLLKGNQEFVMIDEQKVVFEQALTLAKKSNSKNKKVLIVEGGPGTGKSVVAINLLVAITKLKKLTQYITRNSAPRQVYESKLAGSFKKSHISNLFSGSGSYHDVKSGIFDALIVDEAHRLNEKSGMFKNKGENQVKEIIRASNFSVFFIDEDQKVTIHDIGEKEEIRKWASLEGAEVFETALTSQFRCNGSDGYLAWLDNALQIKETANTSIEDIEYDLRVFDSPSELRNTIYEKNKTNNKARLVAGYCWKWLSKNNPLMDDIVFPEYDFSAKWNLSDDGMLWIVKKDSVKEIGCIHTCQGLEVDYIGVIIGPDLIVRNGQVLTDPSKRAAEDSSVRGYKKLMKEDPTFAGPLVDKIIKNTYRTLMTRGQKGCYVYSTDEETQEYFRQLMQS